MPFSSKTFLEHTERHLPEPTQEELRSLCRTFASQKAPVGKARCIRQMMTVLDGELRQQPRQEIMEACGRACLGKTVLEKALRIARQARGLDELLQLLNSANIGGGHLQRQGNVVQASYDQCYCGSVRKSDQPFSATYCYCSCGWYRQLFETILEKPVKVELLSSILQGHDCCRFLIHV